jgi:RNA polymerase sigma-70 factor (ECF subfamily)
MEATLDASKPEHQLRDLMRQIARLDPAALTLLYDQTSPHVFGLILRIVGEPSAAEEVTLDVYAQVWRTADSFDPERGSSLGWLFAIARSRAIDRLRSRPHRQRRQEHSLDQVAQTPSTTPSPEQATSETHRRRLVRQALESIHPEQREAIELAYFSGLTHTEIAQHLQEPLGTVKTRIRLGMLRLKQVLTPYKEVV